MTNEELKKKIVEILDNNIRWQPYYYISRGIVYEDDLKNIADALIAAGMGEVETVRKISIAATKMAVLEAAKAEHRAERAERALHCLARSFAEAMCKDGDDTHYLVDGFIQDAYSQAEKELAEEGKE